MNDMPSAFTTLVTNDRCKELIKAGLPGRRLSVLFASGHQSLPSFERAGVEPGDHVYPVRVERGDLYLLGRVDVERILRGSDVPVGSELDTEAGRWDALSDGCVDEYLFGAGTPLNLTTTVPAGILERLTIVSRRGTRLLRFVEDGRLTRATSFQGVYRLAEESAAELDGLLTTGE
ncbi:MAG TPA: hypothetical protein VGF17_01600 [Phytomonospora sp.]